MCFCRLQVLTKRVHIIQSSKITLKADAFHKKLLFQTANTAAYTSFRCMFMMGSTQVHAWMDVNIADTS